MGGKWRVKIILGSGLVINGLYGTKDGESPEAVIEHLWGFGSRKRVRCRCTILNKDATGYISYRLPDVLAIEIVPVE